MNMCEINFNIHNFFFKKFTNSHQLGTNTLNFVDNVEQLYLFILLKLVFVFLKTWTLNANIIHLYRVIHRLFFTCQTFYSIYNCNSMDHPILDVFQVQVYICRYGIYVWNKVSSSFGIFFQSKILSLNFDARTFIDFVSTIYLLEYIQNM